MKSILKTAAIIGLFTMMFWNQPVYRKYKIDGKGQLKDLKVVLLTDLHNSEYGRDQQKLLKMIQKVSPDLIFFGGDIADEKSDIAPVEKLLMGLKGEFPMYYVSGNHEYWMDDTDGVHQIFRDYGVEVLMDETVQIETTKGQISLVGLTDPDSVLDCSDRSALERSIASTYDSALMKGYKILLSHRSEHIATYMRYDFDLVLSGHAHGGQVRIPWILNGLYSPNQGLLPKYAGGYYRMDDRTDFIVSRGLSFRQTLPRIMNPPELVVLQFV